MTQQIYCLEFINCSLTEARTSLSVSIDQREMINFNIFFFAFRLPWKHDTIPKYLLSVLVHLCGSVCYVSVTYQYVSLLVSSFFYVKTFMEDIQYQMENDAILVEIQIKRNLKNILSLHLSNTEWVNWVHFYFSFLFIELFWKVYSVRSNVRCREQYFSFSWVVSSYLPQRFSHLIM